MGKKTIAVDLDGTLAEYKKWIGVKVIGKPLPGAKEFLEELHRRGYRILIYTARTAGRNKGKDGKYTQEDLNAIVENWFKKHDMPYDAIHFGDSKPAASAFIDDRAVECRPQENAKAYEEALADMERVVNGNANHKE